MDGCDLIKVRYRVTLNGYGTIKAITRRDVSGIGSQPITTTAEIDQSFLSYDSDGGAYLSFVCERQNETEVERGMELDE